MTRPRSLWLPARAKLNLSLRVVGRRADGYHLLETLFHALELHDDLRLELAPTGCELDVTAAHPALQVPAGPDNLVVRALAGLAARAGPAAFPGKGIIWFASRTCWTSWRATRSTIWYANRCPEAKRLSKCRSEIRKSFAGPVVRQLAERGPESMQATTPNIVPAGRLARVFPFRPTETSPWTRK